MLELGGILGVRHGDKPDAFVSAFLGMSGAPGVAKRVLVERAGRVMERHATGSMTFFEYVGSDVVRRINF